jgi:beta-N-acetylhexosaminidase
LLAGAVAQAKDADLLVAAVINRYHVDLVQQVLAATRNLPCATVSLASPYYISLLPQVEAYLCTYSYLDAAQQAAAAAVLGEADMPGQLPVSVPALYGVGHHVELGRPSR